MKTDFYTKVVLTVIAVTLVWIAAGGPSLVPAVQAQTEREPHATLVGWRDGSGGRYDFDKSPLPVKCQ